MPADVRVGIGFDVHPRDEGRDLWLGGVRFEGEDGLAGHSDGDAACHAIADALLGAAALGDIGEHFPEADPAIAGISGVALLSGAVALVKETGRTPAQCDLTVIADRPSISSRRDEMRAAIADVLGISIGDVGVKGTRPEGLGLSGDGVGCLAVVVLA